MFCTSVLWDVSESFEWNSVQVSGSFVSLLDEQGDERLSPSARLLKNAVDGFDLLFWMDTNHYIIDLDAELSLYSMEVFLWALLFILYHHYVWRHLILYFATHQMGLKLIHPPSFSHANAVWTGWEINPYFPFIIFSQLFYILVK